MPENIGNIYNTQIPSFDENADIQTALRLYHYGEDTASPATIQEESIAGHLDNLDNSKISKSPTLIQPQTDLNSITDSGYYIDSNIDRQGTVNYPKVDGESYPGILRVINNNNLSISQQYHMFGNSESPLNIVFWRNYSANSWTAWERVANIDEIISQTNNIYYKIEGTSSETAYSKLQSDNRYAPKFFLEKSRPATYTIALEDITHVVQMDGGTLTIPTNTTTPFPIGSIVNVYNSSQTSFLTIQGELGVTVRNPGTIEPYQEASLRKRAANEWVAAGPVY